MSLLWDLGVSGTELRDQGGGPGSHADSALEGREGGRPPAVPAQCGEACLLLAVYCTSPLTHRGARISPNAEEDLVSREAGLRGRAPGQIPFVHPQRVTLGAAGPRVTGRLCRLLTVPGSPEAHPEGAEAPSEERPDLPKQSQAQPFEMQAQGKSE